jgi:hypothetical protein
VCQGSGQVQSPETVAIEAKRRLRGLLKKPGACRDILIMAHPLVAEYLKTQLHAWDRELNCSLDGKRTPCWTWNLSRFLTTADIVYDILLQYGQKCPSQPHGRWFGNDDGKSPVIYH